MLVGISEAILPYMLHLLRNNNKFFNSFVKILRLKTINKQLNYFHNNAYKLNPWFVTGFVDGDGSFLINVRPKSGRSLSYSVELGFRINLHSTDRALLASIQEYFGVGRLTAESEEYAQYFVGSLKDLSVIINHFDKYPLISQKWSYYKLFKLAFEMVQSKEHLTQEGLNKIVSIKSSLNQGLPEKLKSDFSDIIVWPRPELEKKISIPDPNWVTGFAEAEGCFMIRLVKTTSSYSVNFRFTITQHSRDAELLKTLVDYLGCGRYSVRNSTLLHGDYVVTKFSYIRDKIIPFFDKYPIKGAKSLDFFEFKKVVNMKTKNYSKFSVDSLADIRLIKSRMNKGRKVKSDVSFSLLQGSTPFNSTSGGNRRYFSLKRTICNEAALFQARVYTTLPEYFPFEDKVIYTTNDDKFKEWLAGIIDGEGQLFNFKKGLFGLKIITKKKDKSVLYQIQHKYGGFVKEISKSNAFKYKLVNPKGLDKLFQEINGLIRNPLRMISLNRLLIKKGIVLKEPQPLSYYNGWFSGFFDSEGSIYINEESWQLIISITQKNRFLLEPLQILFGGQITTTPDAFKLSIFRKEDVLKLVYDYFKHYPLKSSKALNVEMIKEFYQLGHHSNLWNHSTDNFKKWIQFKAKWDRIVY